MPSPDVDARRHLLACLLHQFSPTGGIAVAQAARLLDSLGPRHRYAAVMMAAARVMGRERVAGAGRRITNEDLTVAYRRCRFGSSTLDRRALDEGYRAFGEGYLPPWIQDGALGALAGNPAR